MKAFTVGCLGVVLGVLGGVIVVLGVLMIAPQNVEQDIQTFNPVRPDVAVTVSANMVNAQLQPLIRQSGMLQNPTVTLAAPNTIQLNGVMTQSILGQPLAINTITTMHVSTQNGRVLLSIDKVDAGGVNVPPSIYQQAIESDRAQMEDQINQMMQRSLQGSPLKLSNILVAPDGITLQFKS